MKYVKALTVLLVVLFPTLAFAETNTVSSTVVTDKAPPILGIASGITITDENCERMKLSRSLFGMGMKVAAVSTLCQDARVFDAMLMAGTPCPYKGKIGKEAQEAWEENPEDIPSGSLLMADLKKNKVKKKTKTETSKKRKNHDYQVIKEKEDPWLTEED